MYISKLTSTLILGNRMYLQCWTRALKETKKTEIIVDFQTFFNIDSVVLNSLQDIKILTVLCVNYSDRL